MDGIRSSSGGSGCLLAVRPAGEFSSGEKHPQRSAGTGAGRAAWRSGYQGLGRGYLAGGQARAEA